MASLLGAASATVDSPGNRLGQPSDPTTLSLTYPLTRRLFQTLALAAVYFAGARLGLAMAFANPSATPAWPPTGIALAATIALGPHLWPGIFVGAFVANLTTQGSALTALAIAGGNTVAALLGGHLVGRFARGASAFERPLDVCTFVVVAGLLSTALSAATGVTSLVLDGLVNRDAITTMWLTWWLRNIVGAVVVAPPLILWISSPSEPWTRKQITEGLALLGAAILIAVIVFGRFAATSRGGPHAVPVLMWPAWRLAAFPILLWPAFRFGPRETATASLLVSAFAVWGTLHGLGPDAPQNTNDLLLAVQAFSVVNGTAALVLGSFVRQSKAAEASLQAAHAELELRVEQRTAALTESLTSLRDAKDRLRAALRQQEVLLKEIHHRVKNNLAVISSLLYLESLNAVDSQTTAVLQESSRRIRSMALVHETLYASSDLADIDFTEYVRLLASELASAYQWPNQQVTLDTELDEVRLGVDLAVPCGLILSELISNAFKHAFPAGRDGRIVVRVRAADGRLRALEVEDSGIGLPADAHRTRPGSLGLRLIMLLGEQIGASTVFEPAAPGTLSRLTLTGIASVEHR